MAPGVALLMLEPVNAELAAMFDGFFIWRREEGTMEPGLR